MSKPAIQIDNVSFSYERAPVLKQLNLNMDSCRICFLLGNNGSGKTTLLKNIMGFLSPQKGEVKIFGTSVSRMNRHKMSKTISYVPQAIHLNTDFTVFDYLSLGCVSKFGLST